MAGELQGKKIAFFASPEGTEQIELRPRGSGSRPRGPRSSRSPSRKARSRCSITSTGAIRGPSTRPLIR